MSQSPGIEGTTQRNPKQLGITMVVCEVSIKSNDSHDAMELRNKRGAISLPGFTRS
jgi:hypothetical protein